MASTIRGLAVLIAPWLLPASVFAPAGCAYEPEDIVQSTKTLVCRSEHKGPIVFPQLEDKTTAPGTTPVSVAVTDSSDAAAFMTLAVPPGRGVEPSLAVYYSPNDAFEPTDGCQPSPTPEQCNDGAKDCWYRCQKNVCRKETNECAQCRDCCSRQQQICLTKKKDFDFGGCE